MKRREFHRLAAPGLLGGALSGCGGGRNRTRVACEGDSITFGHKVEDRADRCYPAQLQRILGSSYLVRNFGVNGVTLLSRGKNAYIRSAYAQEAVEFAPDIVVLMLGTNDSKRWTAEIAETFVADGVGMLERHHPKPVNFLCLPSPVFPEKFGIKEEVIINEVIPRLREVADRTRAEIIDLHTPFLGRDDLFPDMVHPSAEACGLMAQIVADAILAGS